MDPPGAARPGQPADHGFAARCLLRAARSGTLATQSGGQPFASLVTPATVPDGSVLLLLSALSAHTRHLLAEPRCALMVTGAATGANPQTAPRLTITGSARPEPDPAWRAYWVARHSYAAFYADFADFSLWRLVPEGGHHVGGFGQAAALPASALAGPEPATALLVAGRERIVGHCNATHAEALTGLAPGAEVSRVLGVDADGLDLACGDDVVRLAFDRPAENGPDAAACVWRAIQAACGRRR